MVAIEITHSKTEESEEPSLDPLHSLSNAETLVYQTMQ